jgi:mannose/fructose/N-acetylgalactosamine-specific phosphotransferase system component IIC
MQRGVLLRVVGYWFVFGLGTLAGAWIVGAHAGACSTQLIEVSTDQVTQAVVAALPAAATGSGVVVFKLDVTGIHVHADSAFKDQNFDTTIPAVVRGSPITLEVSSRVLAGMFSH